MIPLRVAFLTGQSDPGRSALSPAQSAFLAALAGPEVEPVSTNFPWNEPGAPWRAVPLLRASLANARQYLAARRGSVPQAPSARAWLAAGPSTFLLVGSTGLALLAALALPPEIAARLRVFAYGGVAPRWPRGVGGCAVLGRRDRLARHFGPSDGPAPRLVAATHLDYLRCPEVLELARMELARAARGER